MSDNFKTDTLDSLCELIVDCPHSTPTWTTFGYVVIRNQNITDGVLDLSSPSYTDYSGYRDRTKRASPQENDIVITREAPMGRVCLIPKEPICCLGQRQVLLRADRNKISAEYLYWSLRSPFVQRQILINEGTGATVSNMRMPVLKALEIPRLASIEIENKKARDLSNIQNKIQLNTQINQTLEQIAQALFKSWFVDFDPVRAKVQALSDCLSLEQAELAAMQAISGKTPEELTALSQAQPECYAELAETAKAFPCEMVEVDGVEVPKGWKIGTFTDITESRREKVKNDKATVLSAVSSGELVKSEEYFTKQVFSKSIDKYLKVYQWDFAYNPARINIGSIGLHEADYLGAVSPVYEVFSVSDKYHWFLKRILNLETTKIKIQSLCTGSVRQTLKLKDFQSIDCVIPDEKTLSIFNKKWEEYRTLILENNENTQTLSEIRDLLLPRLLSGDFNG